MDVAELAGLYRQALEARDDTIRNIVAQAVAQAAAAQLALDQARVHTLRRDKASDGQAVRRLQLLLAERGATIRVDGEFGDETHKAVAAFQEQNGLRADGVAGPVTWAALSGLAHGDEVGEGLAAKARAQLEEFLDVSGKAVQNGDLRVAESLAAEAVAAESMAAEAIASENLAAEAAENRFSGEPFAVESAIAESAVAEGAAVTNAALQTFVAEAAEAQSQRGT